MEKRNPNLKKEKDKSQISDSSWRAIQPENFHKNGKTKKDAYNISYSSPVDKNGNYSSSCKINKHNIPPSKPKQKSFQNSSHCSSAKYSFDDNDDSISDFFKPVFEGHKNKKIQPKNYLDGITMKEEMVSSVNQYNSSKILFSRIYHKWLPERRNTLDKLRSLQEEVHEKKTNYYKSQSSFKKLSYGSRCFKQATENETVDFFASFAAFIGDAASGISSFAQAVEMDSYQTTFQEIMDHDAKITRHLYDSRSQCVSQYRGIEEIIRKFHLNTLTSTVDKIFNALDVDKHWIAMQNAYQKNDMPKLLNEVCKFFDNACQSEVVGNLTDSVQRYVSDNPAALEGCKSTRKAVCGVINAFSEKKNEKNSAVGHINTASNLLLMMDDKQEIDRLDSIISTDTHQSKLELKIEEAIDSFEDELEEMKEIYFQLFNVYDSD